MWGSKRARDCVGGWVGVWVCVCMLARGTLRVALERLRLLAELIAKREKMKRELWKDKMRVFEKQGCVTMSYICASTRGCE